jgi:hypothetical protein
VPCAAWTPRFCLSITRQTTLSPFSGVLYTGKK